MPNTQQRVLPRFPAAIVGTGGITVTIANGVATISAPSSGESELTVSQYVRAVSLVVPNGMATVQAAVPADPDNANRQILDLTRVVPAGGAYETLIATTLSLNQTSINGIRALAALQLP